MLDLTGRTGPLHERLASALRSAIRTGQLPSGITLPPSRTLANDLGCSRWVVTEAYGRLVSEGFLQARTGSGTRVQGDVGTIDPAGTAEPGTPVPRPTSYRYDMLPGVADLRAFPRQRWAEAVRAATTTMVYDDLWYADDNGLPLLRRRLAEYLIRCRGALVTPKDVIVTSGTTNGLAQAFRTLRHAGFTSVAVENPSWQRPWWAAREVGLRVVPIPVDDGGLQVEKIIGRKELRAVLVTPAHQFPTGVSLAPERRRQLLEWLHHVDGVLLEDDYDAEFRYDRLPVPTVQGMDPARVFLFGSVSKTLAPAVGLGWMALPPRWRALVRVANPAASGPSPLTQAAFAHFVTSGGFDRHLRDSRRRLRTRRDALVAALRQRLPEFPVTGIAAGLHLVLELGTAHAGRVPALLARLGRAGVRLSDLDTFRSEPAPHRPGLVLGYGNLTDSVIDEAVAQLATTIDGDARNHR
ncbi:PLP-dependent aminotransferase family protein [Micromonospora sonneratiae]|uniref:PLP-dependent aminotransferase family protein n=1 Tax=Micromonospora sonneratiae TaxID=1184706 RepID=A0ABW3Y525_9ACTN